MGETPRCSHCPHLSQHHRRNTTETQGPDKHNREARQEGDMFCHHCDDSLAGHRYVLRDDHPYCIKCYENVFANNCDESGKIIGIDSKVTDDRIMSWSNSNTMTVIFPAASAVASNERLQHQQVTSTTSRNNIPSYEMIDQIGKGAYGTVYK